MKLHEFKKIMQEALDEFNAQVRDEDNHCDEYTFREWFNGFNEYLEGEKNL